MKLIPTLLLLVGCSGSIDETRSYAGSPFESSNHSTPIENITCTTSVLDDDCSIEQSVVRCTSEIERPDTQYCTGPIDRPNQIIGRVWCCDR